VTNQASSSPQLTARALERRLKRHVRKARQQFFVVCAPGFEDVLEQELTTLPAGAEVTILSKTNGGILLEGHLDAIYYLHLHLATAHRILWRVGKGLAQSYPMLYNKARKLPWEHYLGFCPTYTVHVTASESYLNHQRGIAECLADAIRYRLEPLGLLAKHVATSNETPDESTIEIYVRLFQDRCTLSINTSGAHLHKRGYRDHSYAAPLRETLAAAVLRKLNLANYTTFIDSMCGSGTLLIEAALSSRGMPLGFVVDDDTALGEREVASPKVREYDFENLPIFQASKWQRLGREALSAALPKSRLKIFGGDISEDAIKLSHRHALRAGVADDIRVMNCDASAWLEPSHSMIDSLPKGPILMLCNAPYGQRLGEVDEVCTTLQTLQRQAHQHNLTCLDKPVTFAVITSPKVADKLTGFKVRKRFRNGGLKVVLLEVDSSA
jgi:putative N6-adenine-specific DNA methylase